MRRDFTSDVAQDKFDVETEARLRGIQPYQVRAANAVGDRLVRDIVADAYKGISASASMVPPSREPAKPRGNGWVEASPLKPPDVRWCDRQMDAQDKLDRAALLRQRAENDWVEGLLERRNPYKAKIGYDPVQSFDNETPSCHREK
jgi:hypothetical protein